MMTLTSKVHILVKMNSSNSGFFSEENVCIKYSMFFAILKQNNKKIKIYTRCPIKEEKETKEDTKIYVIFNL